MCTVDLPERMNAATVLVDSHVEQGRADKAAILCGDVTVTYHDLRKNVNRFGNVGSFSSFSPVGITTGIVKSERFGSWNIGKAAIEILPNLLGASLNVPHAKFGERTAGSFRNHAH